MRCHNLIKTTGQWFSFKECSEHDLKRNALTSYNYNPAFVCFCFHLIGHFTVMDGSEGDLVLIQTLLLYYVNKVIIMLTSIFKEKFT